MDTITHLTLGACIGQAVAGRIIGKRAILLGAVVQNIPDADIITSLWLTTPQYLLAHRGFSHSIFLAILITPLLAWILARKKNYRRIGFPGWLLFIGIEVGTHLFIDAFNAYGTGWFEPFSTIRISFHTLYVVDPFFTIWTLIATIALLLIKDLRSSQATVWIRFGLIATVLYFIYALYNKSEIERNVDSLLAAQKISSRHFTTPTPFNSWLWYIVVERDSGYLVGYRSVFDRQKSLDLDFFPKNDRLLQSNKQKTVINNLKTFSQGYYTVENRNDTLVFNILRFGQILGWQKPHARFTFYYFLDSSESNTMVMQRGRFKNWDRQTVAAYIRRIEGR